MELVSYRGTKNSAAFGQTQKLAWRMPIENNHALCNLILKAMSSRHMYYLRPRYRLHLHMIEDMS